MCDITYSYSFCYVGFFIIFNLTFPELMYQTEFEIYQSQKQSLYLLERGITQARFTLEEICECLPGYFMMNSLDDLTTTFLSRNYEEYFSISREILNQIKEVHLKKCYDPSSYKEIIPMLVCFGKEADPHKVVGYLNQLRQDERSEFRGHIGFAKIAPQFNCFITLLNPVDTFGSAAHKMSRLIDDNEFLRRNFRKFSQLSKREIEIIKLVALGTPRSEIAERLCISKHTLDNHRKNIRTKLEISTAAELFRYIRAFDLL